MKTQETRMMTVAVGALALMVLAPGTFVQALGIYWDGTSA